MHNKPMKRGAGTERELQARYRPVAGAMRDARPSTLGGADHIWGIRLDTWRDCIEALCSAYALTDEDFNADVFRLNCNW